MKRPSEAVKEVCFENLKRTRENTKFIFEHSDKFIVWIVGFSLGGISLIVSNPSKVDKVISYTLMKSILILLTTSIIFGIFYRITYYLYQIYYQQIEFFIESSFSNKKFMEIETDDLTNETDIKEVIRRLKEDFGEDLFYIFDIYDQSNLKTKEFLLNDLKSHYKKTGEWAKKDFELGIEFVKDTLKTAFGFSEKKFTQIFNEKISTKLKVYSWLTTTFFFLTCLSFIAVVIIFCITY